MYAYNVYIVVILWDNLLKLSATSLIQCVLFLFAASLVGQTAPPEMLQKLTYLVIKHDPLIQRVDTVRAYTFGVLYFVEVWAGILHW